jgi:glycosyltransferase involved in cell wall biosynthesis
MDGDNDDQPVRILRLFSRLNVGGPSVHVILLSAGLRERGYDTRLVVGQESPTEGNLLELARQRGVECTRLPALGREIRPLSDLRALLQLVRLIRDFRPRIVHTHTAKAGLLGRIAARLCGVPVVVHTFHGHVLRGYFGPARTAFFRLLERGLAHLTDELVAVSEAVRSDLVELGVAPAGKIRVVPLGLELERLSARTGPGRLRAALAIAPSAPLVGIVGRLVPIKDLPTFLRAAALVVRERPETAFAVVGDGELRAELEALAEQLGLSGKVSFAGWWQDMADVMPDLDVVVNSSRNEGTPVALIEALACRRPVVATRAGGNAELLGEGERGLLVPQGDPQALARAVLQALSDSGPARARAERGCAHVLRQHSVGRLLGDLDAMYRELQGRAA